MADPPCQPLDGKFGKYRSARAAQRSSTEASTWSISARRSRWSPPSRWPLPPARTGHRRPPIAARAS